jgi:hypothetical protein
LLSYSNRAPLRHGRETLTGFKWLGNIAKDCEAEGLEAIFAFEAGLYKLNPVDPQLESA